MRLRKPTFLPIALVGIFLVVLAWWRKPEPEPPWLGIGPQFRVLYDKKMNPNGASLRGGVNRVTRIGSTLNNKQTAKLMIGMLARESYSGLQNKAAWRSIRYRNQIVSEYHIPLPAISEKGRGKSYSYSMGDTYLTIILTPAGESTLMDIVEDRKL